MKFEENNPDYLIFIWEYKEDRYPWSIYYRNPKFRELKHNSTVFQFIYHDGHFSAITMEQSFYKFVYNPTDRKKIYVCLSCGQHYYTEDELIYPESHCGDPN